LGVCGGGVWVLGLGVSPQTPTPKTQIPNPQSPIYFIKLNIIFFFNI